MTWMSDEKYELMQDTKEKKITARSARSTRTHCGKGGKVRLPSDKLSAKELEKMNGECKSYRLNDPMTWKEFKDLPDDLKVIYIKALRKRYNVPDLKIAEMFGVNRTTLYPLFKKLGLTGAHGGDSRKEWEEAAWYIWRGYPKSQIGISVAVDEKKEAEAVEYIENDIETVGEAAENIKTMGDGAKAMIDSITKLKNALTPEEERAAQRASDKRILEALECCETNATIAVPSKGEMTFEGTIDDILRTLSTVLQGKKVRLAVKWTVTEAELSKAAQYAILNAERRKMLNSKG